MPSAQPTRIVCPSCKRSGPYRPELAGKRLKCKCGGTIEVPAASTAEDDEPLHIEPVRPAAAASMPAEQPENPDDGYDIREDDIPKRPVERPADVVSYRTATSEAPEEPAPQTYPTFARPKTYGRNVEAEQSQLVKLVILLVVIVGIIAGSIFGIKMLKGSGPTGPQLGEDQDIEAKLSDEYHKEIHAWFQEDSSRIMGPWTQSQALSQADRWQQDGAKQVIAFGSRMSMVAVIELPDDPAKRKALFDWQAQWHRDHFQKVWGDVGQKYLMIRVGF